MKNDGESWGLNLIYLSIKELQVRINNEKVKKRIKKEGSSPWDSTLSFAFVQIDMMAAFNFWGFWRKKEKIRK